MNKIKKNDVVVIISGKDKGKKGTVLTVLDNGRKLVIENINVAKRHTKPNPNKGDKGGIVIKPMAIDRSKVMLFNDATGKATRIGIRILDDGRKVRYYKDNNEVVDNI